MNLSMRDQVWFLGWSVITKVTLKWFDTCVGALMRRVVRLEGSTVVAIATLVIFFAVGCFFWRLHFLVCHLSPMRDWKWKVSKLIGLWNASTPGTYSHIEHIEHEQIISFEHLKRKDRTSFVPCFLILWRLWIVWTS